MASNFLVSLRETARLYLRYMAVGLVVLPFALVYALARDGWNLRILQPMLAGCGLVAPFLLWRRMADWQVTPIVEPIITLEFDARWAELMNASRQSGAIGAPQRVIVLSGDITSQAWNEFLTPQQHMLASVSHHGTNEQLAGTSQELLSGQRLSGQRLSETKKPNMRPESSPQRQPAWALALSGQIPTNARGSA